MSRDAFVSVSSSSGYGQMLARGHKVIALTLSQRCVLRLADFLNKTLYRGEMRILKGVTENQTALQLEQFSKHTFAKNTPLIINDVKYSVASIKYGQHYNTINACAVAETVGKLCAARYKLCDMAIITLYPGQAKNHCKRPTTFACKNKLHLRTMSVMTFDNARGQEWPIVLMDVCVTDTRHFLDYAKRLLTAASRAKYLLVIYGSIQQIRVSWKYTESNMARIVNFCTQKDVVVNCLIDAIPKDLIDVSKPVVSEYQCDNCGRPGHQSGKCENEMRSKCGACQEYDHVPQHCSKAVPARMTLLTNNLKDR